MSLLGALQGIVFIPFDMDTRSICSGCRGSETLILLELFLVSVCVRGGEEREGEGRERPYVYV